MVMNRESRWLNLIQYTILILATGTDKNLKGALLKQLIPGFKLGTSRHHVSCLALCQCITYVTMEDNVKFVYHMS